ncbi:uncharacterized protein [Ptychodera flava]|uniref:uncharacterized protein n=1 Tax=Ptychodera flava TaxID=63121 RepID=UPI003969FED5
MMVDMNTYALFPQSVPQSEGDLLGLRHIWNQSYQQNSQVLISHSNQQMTGETVSKGDKGPPGFRRKMEMGMRVPGGAVRQTLPEHSGPSEHQCTGMIGDSEQTSDPGKMEMIGHSKETYERTEVPSYSNKQNEDQSSEGVEQLQQLSNQQTADISNSLLSQDHGTVQNQPVHHQQFPGQQQPMSQVAQQPLLIPPQYYVVQTPNQPLLQHGAPPADYMQIIMQTPNQTQPLLQHGAPPADYMQMFMQTLTTEQQQLLMQAAKTTEISGGSAFQAPSSASENQNKHLSQMQTSLHTSIKTQHQTQIQPAPHPQSQDQTQIKEPLDSISQNQIKIQEPQKPTSQNQNQIGELPQPVFQNQTQSNVRDPQPMDQNQSKIEAPPAEPLGTFSETEHHLDTPSDDEDEKTVNDTIEVTGLDKTKNNLEILQLYFESKRSGGGPVKNIEELDKGKKLQITFESAEVVPRVLERSHKCQDVQLTVTLAPKRKKKRKLPRDTKAILLKGLSDDTNRETIDLYMESRTGIEEAPSMFFGDKPGIVLLKYSKDIPDFESVVHKVAKRRLNKVKISAEPVYLTDSILAQNLPPNVTEDVVTMYFENSARSGGGDVDYVRFNKKKCLAVVSFRDYRVVDRVLERNHYLNNLRLDVQPYHECLGCESIDSCDEDQETSQSLSSGQYTSQSMEGEMYGQQNTSSGDADPNARMIQRMKKEKRKRKPSELPRDKTSMILKGLADDTSAETILLYMESCTRIEEDPELIFGEEPGTVMVRYDEDIEDFEKITHRISKKKLSQATVTVQPAYHTDCVLVEDLPPNVSEDSLALYFESVKRSGGGEVDDVDLDEERNSAKVFFKDCRVVDNVLHKTHEIDQRQVTVQPFYASLGYMVSSGELTPRIPKPVTDDVDPLIMEFIMAKQNQYTEEFKETLHDAHTDIEWPHQEQSDKVLLKPTLTSDTKDLHKIVKSWSKNAKSTLIQYLQGTRWHNHSFRRYLVAGQK